MIVLPYPDKKLNPNARTHWALRAKATKAARHVAHYTAVRAGIPTLPDGEILLDVTFQPPDLRRRDRTNAEASMKAYFDGIADAWGCDDVRFAPRYHWGEVSRPNGLVKVEIANA